MEKTFEEKFGLKTEEMEEILGGVVEKFTEFQSICSSDCLMCSSCVTCTSDCTLCSECYMCKMIAFVG